MSEKIGNPQDQNPPAATATPVNIERPSEDLPFYCVPAPPVPGKTAWSLRPWQPE